MYSIPPTPPVSAAVSTKNPLDQNYKCVALTRITRFLPSHILQVLLSKDYTVRGIITAAEYEAHDPGVESLFDIHPLARQFLFIQRVQPLNQKDWERVLDSTTHVIHMVTPVSRQKGLLKGHDQIQATLEMTRCLLRACVKVKSVQRLILITSTASIAWSRRKAAYKCHYNEDSWEDEKNLSGYAKCQLMCEKAAWDFVNCLPESDKVELVVLNPAFMLGPIIRGRSTTTIDIIKALMENKFRWLPSASIPLIDVRDVAQATAVALVNREAVGRRHILFCATVCLEDIIHILQDEFTRQGYNVMSVPSLQRCGCICCFRHRLPHNLSVLEELMTKSISYDNTRMRTVLNANLHVPEETIVETAYSLIFWNFIEKKGSVLHSSSLNVCAVSDSKDHNATSSVFFNSSNV